MSLSFKRKSNTKSNYSTKIKIPQYLPSGKCPKLEELFDNTKYKELIYSINKSKVSEEEKKFLKLAASRHLIFNYSKIADYYANADIEMQNLMEQSALVILDVNDAIANGYVKFSKDVLKLLDITDDYGDDVCGYK